MAGRPSSNSYLPMAYIYARSALTNSCYKCNSQSFSAPNYHKSRSHHMQQSTQIHKLGEFITIIVININLLILITLIITYQRDYIINHAVPLYYGKL